jgi:hypothetical protein
MFWGSIEIKNGKPSYSLMDSKSMSGAERSKMKEWARVNVLPGLVEADAAVKKDTKGLLNELFTQTQDLKESYISKTKEYAKNFYGFAEKENGFSLKEWCEKFGIGFDGKNPIVKTREENEKWGRLIERRYEVKLLTDKGFTAFEEKEVTQAINHYNNSIEKLCFRLNRLGVVDGSEFKIENPRLGINMELYIYYPGGVVHAYTIIAEGPIQRPHYRYLIK